MRETLADDAAIDEVGAVGVGLGVLQRDVGDLGEGLVGEECLVGKEHRREVTEVKTSAERSR